MNTPPRTEITVTVRPDAGLVATSGPEFATLRLWGNGIELQADLDRQQANDLARALRHGQSIYAGGAHISLFSL